MIVDFTVSLPFLLAIGSAFVGLFAWFWSLKSTSDKTKEDVLDMKKDYTNVKKEISDFKLEIAQNYASTSHLRETESRLTNAISTLTDEVRQLRQSLLDIVKK